MHKSIMTLKEVMDAEQPITSADCDPSRISALGELIVWAEESGYCTPAISIKTDSGEISLDAMVEKLIPGIKMSGGRKGVIVEVTMRVKRGADIILARKARTHPTRKNS